MDWEKWRKEENERQRELALATPRRHPAGEGPQVSGQTAGNPDGGGGAAETEGIPPCPAREKAGHHLLLGAQGKVAGSGFELWEGILEIAGGGNQGGQKRSAPVGQLCCSGRRTFYVNKTEATSKSAQFCPCLAPQPGLEPGTRWLTATCSTD